MVTTQYIEAVYFYPPTNGDLAINSITGATIDQYGMVVLTYNPDVAFVSNAVNVYITPQGFTEWYAATLSYISNSSAAQVLAEVNNTATNTYKGYSNLQEYATATIANEGYTWVPLSNWYSTIGILDNIAIGAPGDEPTMLIGANSSYLTNVSWILANINSDANVYVLTNPNNTVVVPIISSTNPASPVQIPTWVPYALIGFGILIVIFYLLTAGKGAVETVSGVQKIKHNARQEHRSTQKEKRDVRSEARREHITEQKMKLEQDTLRYRQNTVPLRQREVEVREKKLRRKEEAEGI